MTGIARYFPAEPQRSTLAAIEGVNLIELSPQNIEQGAGTGVVCVVGECEDGPYNSPTEVRSPDELIGTFGGFGHVHDGTPYQSPVARRTAGSELWNGNLFLGLSGNQFSRLIIVRVKTASGQVRLRRYASLTSIERGPHDLEPGDVATFNVDGAPVTATIAATAGSLLAVGGVYPTTFTGTEKLLWKDEFGNIYPVKFAATDQANTDVVDAINKQLGYAAASLSGGQILMRSRIRGSRGYIELVGGTASAIAQLGFTTTNTAEVDSVTVAVAAAGIYTFTVDVLYNGIITTYTGTFTRVLETIADIRIGLKADFAASNPDAPVTLTDGGAGVILVTSNVAGIPITTVVTATPNALDFVAANVTPNSASFANGTGNVRDCDRVLDPELVTMLAALGGLNARMLDSGFVRIWNDSTPETGTLEFVTGAVGEAMGFVEGQSANAGAGLASFIPAGTRVLDDAGFYWVTCQSTTLTTEGGPFLFDVRPANDDDSTPTANAGTVNELVDVLEDEFIVDNTVALTRLSSAGIDTAYRAALASTIDPGSAIATTINILTCARFSEAINANLASNIPEANADEHALRVGVFGAPLGQSVTNTISDTAFGVPVCGRSRTLFYCYPGILVRVPAIAELGVAGGLGFADDGLVNKRSNILISALMSRLAPEESLAQDLTRTVVGRQLHVVGLEDTFNSARGGIGLKTSHYIALKAAGVLTTKMDAAAGFCVQSDLTTKPESENSDECNGNHRRMWHFLGDSFRRIAKPYVGTLRGDRVRLGLVESLRLFLKDLKSENNPDQARIADFICADITVAPWLGLGHADIRLEVQLLGVYKYINLRTKVTAQGIQVAA